MMPLIVKDFTWTQNPTTVYITVKINGIRRDKSSFITADNYIRLHYPPYYFEVFLWGEVDEVAGKATLEEKEGFVVFEMPKREPGVEWPTLDVQDLSKAEKHQKRLRATEMSNKRANEEMEKALARRHEQKQLSVHEQLRLDDEARKRIAAIKSFDTRTALEQFNDWKMQENLKSQSDDGEEKYDTAATEVEMHEEDPSDSEHKTDDQMMKQILKMADVKVDADAIPDLVEGNAEISSPPQAKAKTAEKKKPIWDAVPPKESSANCPPVRAGGSLTISFTPREFPTPSRESMAAEEEEWLKKRREAMRKSGFNDADLREEERDPNWLLQKGESLMKAESYLGAVSAFSTGLKLAPKMPELYAARATSHLHLCNFRRVVEDSTQALEMFTPKVAKNASGRLTAHAARGRAYYKLKMYPEAVGDLKEALKLDPEDSKLQEEVRQAEVDMDREALMGPSSDEDDS